MKSTLKVNKKVDFAGHTGSVYALSAAAVADEFYSGGSDKLIAQWNTNQPSEGKLLARTNDIIYSLLNINEKGLLLAGQAAGGIHVINTVTNAEERLLQYHEAPVFDMCMSNVHHLLFTLAGDGGMAMIDASDFSLISRSPLIQGKLRSAALNDDESLIAVGAGDGSVFIFSLPDMKPVYHGKVHQENFSVNAVSFSPDGKYLLTGSRDAHLKIFDVKNNFKEVHSIPAHNYAIYSIVWHPSHSHFATASRDKTIKVWDPSTFEVVLRLDNAREQGHVNSVNKLIYLNDGRLISGSDDRSVMLWSIH